MLPASPLLRLMNVTLFSGFLNYYDAGSEGLKTVSLYRDLLMLPFFQVFSTIMMPAPRV